MPPIYNILPSHEVLSFIGMDDLENVKEFQGYWDDLIVDNYINGANKYRRRRYSVFHVRGDELSLCPHQPHYQSSLYNKVFGGIFREFSSIDWNFVNDVYFKRLIKYFVGIASSLARHDNWRLQAHQFRITAPGLPTPEGVHQDGEDYIFVFLVNKINVFGGISTIYGLDGRILHESNLGVFGDSIFIDDKRVFHGVSKIERTGGGEGIRDALVMSLEKI